MWAGHAVAFGIRAITVLEPNRKEEGHVHSALASLRAGRSQ